MVWRAIRQFVSVGLYQAGLLAWEASRTLSGNALHLCATVKPLLVAYICEFTVQLLCWSAFPGGWAVARLYLQEAGGTILYKSLQMYEDWFNY